MLHQVRSLNMKRYPAQTTEAPQTQWQKLHCASSLLYLGRVAYQRGCVEKHFPNSRRPAVVEPRQYEGFASPDWTALEAGSLQSRNLVQISVGGMCGADK
jgi:hypothetical protein